MKKYKVYITYRVTVETEIESTDRDTALDIGYDITGMCSDEKGGLWTQNCISRLIVNDEPICDESRVEEVQR